VILQIGEIDCREGMVSSLERDYHDSFDAAVAATLSDYLLLLADLVAKRKFTVHTLLLLLNTIPFFDLRPSQSVVPCLFLASRL
jgi:hypothetical protein